MHIFLLAPYRLWYSIAYYIQCREQMSVHVNLLDYISYHVLHRYSWLITRRIIH